MRDQGGMGISVFLAIAIVEHFIFALVLAIFLVSLALGSALVSLLADRLRSPWTLTAWGAALGALAVM